MDGVQKIINYLITDKKKDRYSIFKKLLQEQSWDNERQSRVQDKKLIRLMDHAFSYVPFYKSLLNQEQIKNKPWRVNPRFFLTGFPILTRQKIIDNFNGLISSDSNLRKPYKNSSGGSSGTPVTVLQDEFFFENAIAHQLLVNYWHGINTFDSVVKIWGAERDTYLGKKPLVTYLKDFLRNRFVISSFNLNPDKIREIINSLNRKRPKLILAYVDSIYQIALFARENNIRVIAQRAIHCGAGTLFDFMRDEIEKVFQCPVYNHYGTREVSSIASECARRDGLHLMTGNVYVEVIHDGGTPCLPGEEGRIVVTALNNYSMPLIRYDIGDIGIMMEDANCSCGCTYPKLSKVIGRSAEMIKNKDGDIIIPEYFIHLIGVGCNDGSIRSFQVIQKNMDHIHIRMVKNIPFNKNVLKEIDRKIRIVMGTDCKVTFEFVSELAKGPTGKIKYIVNEVE